MPRILIVDDDEDMRSIAKENLSKSYEVIDTGFPENALAMAVQLSPDVILLDLGMPGVSGFELCQALSSLTFTQQIPIFIISGQDERNRAFCQKLGASRYFTKPINYPELKATLAQVLSSKSAQRRKDVRVQLKISLILRGQTKAGHAFEIAAITENISSGGFLCNCSAPLDTTSKVDVSLCGEGGHRLGEARLVRVENTGNSTARYGFQFEHPADPR